MHTVLAHDIKGELQPPEIVMCGGTRLLYRFKGNYPNIYAKLQGIKLSFLPLLELS